MLALRNPQEAYRKVDFDARIEGADPRQLVSLCYEQFVAALSSALFAHAAGNNPDKSRAITRALSAATALRLGVSGDGAVSLALLQYYASVRNSLLDAALNFQPETIATIRQDFTEIAAALGSAANPPIAASTAA